MKSGKNANPLSLSCHHVRHNGTMAALVVLSTTGHEHVGVDSLVCSSTAMGNHDALGEARQPRASTSQRHFRCTHPGCERQFSRAGKLHDHLRTHTGERPFQCVHPGCHKAFRRADHLQRHARSHATADGDNGQALRPFACPIRASPDGAVQGECGRRFMSRQHLLRHIRDVHKEEEGDAEAEEEEEEASRVGKRRPTRMALYRCDVGACHATFHKRKSLRAHIRMDHSDAGRALDGRCEEEARRMARLPFACTHAPCPKRFPTNAKRHAHVQRHHDNPARYLCTLPHTQEQAPSGYVQLATWSELQAHHRQCHPPRCPHKHCGKTFREARNLRLHLHRMHGEHEARDEGRGTFFACGWTPHGTDAQTCPRVFGTKYNRDVHIRTTHLGIRAFACPKNGCERRFGTKRAALRHAHKCTHGAREGAGKHSGGGTRQEEEEQQQQEEEEEEEEQGVATDAESSGDDDFFRREGGAVPEEASDRPKAQKRMRARDELQSSKEGAETSLVSVLTGQSYAQGASSQGGKRRRVRGRIIACPWPRICAVRDDGEDKEVDRTAEEEEDACCVRDARCPFRFSRLYDAQRHLRSAHGIALTQMDICALLGAEERSLLASPRNGTQMAMSLQGERLGAVCVDRREED